jgi:hypothetical protein
MTVSLTLVERGLEYFFFSVVFLTLSIIQLSLVNGNLSIKELFPQSIAPLDFQVVRMLPGKIILFKNLH